MFIKYNFDVARDIQMTSSLFCIVSYHLICFRTGNIAELMFLLSFDPNFKGKTMGNNVITNSNPKNPEKSVSTWHPATLWPDVIE